MFLRVCVGFWSLRKHTCVYLKISECKFQKSFLVLTHSHVYMHIVSECAYVVKVSPHCVFCLLLSACAWICVCTCVRLHSRAGIACAPSQTPFWTPLSPPPCDELSWMLMFCDGCEANKCFWHSTGSHYRSRPNGLARALMSRQVSQPQQLYWSHMLLMQGRTSAPLDQNLE